ncbi:MAG TPA: hypothetical protein VLM89_00775 [Phycisphaerae bacterium]|nr:hypothetical protein [Phycisphaerae bacterium]
MTFPAWSLLLLAAVAGCRDGETVFQPVADSCLKPPVTVRQTYDCLRAWHGRGAYGAMRPYIDPSAVDSLIDLLVAVDELMAANASALSTVARACPGMDDSRLDLSYLERYMDLFSRDVEFIREQQKGDQATMTIQVADRLPLIELRFRRAAVARNDFRWVYTPGRAVPELTNLLRDITGGLNQFALVLSHAEGMTPESVQREFDLRVMTRLRRHAALLSASRPAES